MGAEQGRWEAGGAFGAVLLADGAVFRGEVEG